MYYNYIIQNKINSKRYVGFTHNHPEKRWADERRAAFNVNSTNYHLPLSKAIRKYGWTNFSTKIVGQWETAEEALEYEKFLISYYYTNMCRYGTNYGYNMTDGGEATIGYKHRKSSKHKMAIAKQGIYDGKNNPFYGKHHTENTKNKVRGSKNAMAKLTEEQVIQIRYLYAGEGMTQQQLSDLYGVSRRHISDIINYINWRHI